MKPIMIIGIILIVLGLAGLIFNVVKYTTREKVIDLPGVEVTAKKEHTVIIPGIVGGLALAAGVAIVVVGSRKSSS